MRLDVLFRVQNFVPHQSYYGEEPAEIAEEASKEYWRTGIGHGPQLDLPKWATPVSLDDMKRLIAEAKRILPGVGIQVPPNLADWWPELVAAGATDLGGLSANGDHISPEHPFPSPHKVRKRLAQDGLNKSNTLFVITVDEGDHFVGVQKTNCDGVHIPCIYGPNEVGEISANIDTLVSHQFPSLATSFLGGAAPNAFTVHGDSAPTFYLAKKNAGPLSQTDSLTRTFERTIANLTAVNPYTNATDTLMQRMRDCPKAEGVSEILIPGEPETRHEAERRRTGIPYSANEIAALQEEAKRAGTSRLEVSAKRFSCS